MTVEHASSSSANGETVLPIETKKPCRVCTDFRAWMHKKPSTSPSSNPSLPMNSASTKENPSSPWGSQEPLCPCPPDSQELGRHTWTFLHTLAAYYPNPPTLTHQRHAKNLIYTLSSLYPCEPCAHHLTDYLTSHPPQVHSYLDLNQWLCDFHNAVNQQLGKPIFDCTRVLERWKESKDQERCGD
ncbi:hypothetical protein HMI54_001687 [Coelomomyces lativittatus]|nr:hypothetical protein HMI56_002654 [Coelomomyces lativittatus]KAJ1513940.1 hypothetical protein HMI55_005100 [Coelomomyces lativittatus]KAJ1518258.1 hypothetical protein HMI54_001687 [Coelomomyces lativittatus]